MKIWLATMECAGIAEAGGVKDVSYSLATGFARAGNDVTLFIPVFGCTSFSAVEKLQKNAVQDVSIPIGEKDEKISYSTALLSGTAVRVVFVHHPSFQNKRAVYVYTEEDQKENPNHVRGTGHDDSLFLDALFSKAVCEYARFITAPEIPDVIHCQDASTAIIPCYAQKLRKDFFKETKYVVTIHNAGPAYHHFFQNLDQALYYTGLDYSILNQALNNFRVEPFLLAAIFARITTVSTYYAEELMNPDNSKNTDGLSLLFHEKNIHITGITNGIDYRLYRPEQKSVSMLPFAYKPRIGRLSGKKRNRRFFLKLCRKSRATFSSARAYTENVQRYGWIDVPRNQKQAVFFMYHGRIVWQKGITLLLEAIGPIISKYPDARFFIAGQGDPDIENKIKHITERFDGKVVFFNGYNNPLSHLVAAAADFAVLPSFFEPCCLEDFIAQIFGTIPIAHSTGGLKKILDAKSGFLYMHNTPESLERSIDRAMRLFSNKNKLKDMIVWTANYIHKIYNLFALYLLALLIVTS